MSKIKALVRSPHIQIAVATGICIIVIAYFGKKIFTEPVGNLTNAIPGFIMLLYELLYSKYKKKKIFRVKYWVTGIIIITMLIIILNYD